MRLSSNKKSFDKELKTENTLIYVPVRKVENKVRTLSLISYGQVLPNSEIIVSMEVQGKLTFSKGDVVMKPGTNFRAGQILYRVDNEEAFWTLNARKASLSAMILNAMPDVELDFPSEKKKWLEFMSNLSPTRKLPELPAMSAREGLFMTGRNILSEYYNLRSMEARLEKYFFAAPFNGTVIATYAEPGAIANPGAQLAKIARTGEYEVKVPIAIDDLETYRGKSSAEFTDAKGNRLASGKIIRISNVINQLTQSADVYYSLAPDKDALIYNGMHLNVKLNQQSEKLSVTLPTAAVKNGKVYVLKDGKLNTRQVLVVSRIPDSLFVTGLNNGEMVVLEQVSKVEPKYQYKGIER
jgi:multidrug efflux pump subunit AcrA (membrane-fusion protein)